VPEPAAAPTTPLERSNLPALVGRYPGSYAESNIDLSIRVPLALPYVWRSARRYPFSRPTSRRSRRFSARGNLYYIMGNASHRGGEDQAYVLIDSTKRAVQVGPWEQGKLTV
jgi:hypothetical protein